MHNKCPVCSKLGIPDYRVNQIRCPQCDSDLSSFHYTAKLSSPKKRLILFPIVFGIAIAIGVIIYSINLINKKDNIIADKEALATTLTDSLLTLKGKKSDSTITHIYTVKFGDNCSKIAKLFYGEYSHYEKIEKENNLKRGDFIFPGQELIIKLKAK